jgi:hypothetical protein
MMLLVTGIIGLVMMATFLGILIWWIKALPFTVIAVAVVSMMVWDFVQTVRSSNGGAGR